MAIGVLGVVALENINIIIIITIIIIIIITSISDLQPSTAIVNQSLGKSVSTSLNHNNTVMYL